MVPCSRARQDKEVRDGVIFLSLASTSSALSGWLKAWLANGSTGELVGGLQHRVYGTQSSAKRVGEETCLPPAGQKVKRPGRLLGKFGVR